MSPPRSHLPHHLKGHPNYRSGFPSGRWHATSTGLSRDTFRTYPVPEPAGPAHSTNGRHGHGQSASEYGRRLNWPRSRDCRRPLAPSCPRGARPPVPSTGGIAGRHPSATVSRRGALPLSTRYPLGAPFLRRNSAQTDKIARARRAARRRVAKSARAGGRRALFAAGSAAGRAAGRTAVLLMRDGCRSSATRGWRSAPRESPDIRQINITIGAKTHVTYGPAGGGKRLFAAVRRVTSDGAGGSRGRQFLGSCAACAVGG